MAVRRFKEIDYFRLVILLYKTAGRDFILLEVLFNYAILILKSNGFDKGYIDKLKSDVLIYDVNIVDRSIIELKLCDLLGREGVIMFMADMFDIVNSGYLS